jgi:hypothetical protein
VCSMPSDLLGIEVTREQRLGIATEASVATVDEVFVTVDEGWPQIEATGQDRLDRAIERGGMRERPLTGGLESCGAVGVPEPQNALSAA